MFAILAFLLFVGIVGPPLLQIGLTLLCLSRIEAPVRRGPEAHVGGLRRAWILVTGLVGSGALALAWCMTHRGSNVAVMQFGMLAGCFLWFLRPPLTCGLMKSAEVATRQRIVAMETV